MTDEITELLDHHWHIRHGRDDADVITIEGCNDPCTRADPSFYLLPAVGPLGVEIAARLRQPSTFTVSYTVGRDDDDERRRRLAQAEVDQ